MNLVPGIIMKFERKEIMNRIPFYIKNIYALPEPFDRFHVVVRGENFHFAPHTESIFHVYLIMEGDLDITMGSEKVSLSKGRYL